MKGKQQISLWIHYEDYEELKKSPLGVSGAVREALNQYLLKPVTTIEQLQKVIKAYEQRITELTATLPDTQQTDDLTKIPLFVGEILQK